MPLVVKGGIVGMACSCVLQCMACCLLQVDIAEAVQSTNMLWQLGDFNMTVAVRYIVGYIPAHDKQREFLGLAALALSGQRNMTLAQALVRDAVHKS